MRVPSVFLALTTTLGVGLGVGALGGCGPVSATIISEGDFPVDTGDPDTDSDTDSDTDVDTDTDTDPPPPPIYGEWIGTRVIDFGRCDGELEEGGTLTDDPEAQGACPECELIYRIDVAPGSVCGVSVRSPAWRGVILDRRNAIIMNLVPTDRGWASEPLAEGIFERNDEIIVIDYEYRGQVGRSEFEAVGHVELLRTN